MSRTIKQLVETKPVIISRDIQSSSKVQPTTFRWMNLCRPVDIDIRVANPSKPHKQLGWMSRATLDELITKMQNNQRG